MLQHTGSTAIISPCGEYRYHLTRCVDSVGCKVAVGMVNPSTADATENDATIRKLLGFGSRLGWSEITVFNKFAFRATDVNALKSCNDPIGPMNDLYIGVAMAQADVIVVAWGSLSKLPPHLRDRWKYIIRMAQMLNKPLHCFGVCADGHPKHPVMIPYGNIAPWNPPACPDQIEQYVAAWR